MENLKKLRIKNGYLPFNIIICEILNKVDSDGVIFVLWKNDALFKSFLKSSGLKIREVYLFLKNVICFFILKNCKI